ncbi:hypothetical protein ACEWY4_002314 [Coilia grayii]|uniref:Uncharacterized protein n=1 Tax=Coilia grayii TaxID=363190 RepID=A0ABD1KN51_9TELE
MKLKATIRQTLQKLHELKYQSKGSIHPGTHLTELRIYFEELEELLSLENFSMCAWETVRKQVHHILLRYRMLISNRGADSADSACKWIQMYGRVNAECLNLLKEMGGDFRFLPMPRGYPARASALYDAVNKAKTDDKITFLYEATRQIVNLFEKNRSNMTDTWNKTKLDNLLNILYHRQYKNLQDCAAQVPAGMSRLRKQLCRHFRKVNNFLRKTHPKTGPGYPANSTPRQAPALANSTPRQAPALANSTPRQALANSTPRQASAKSSPRQALANSTPRQASANSTPRRPWLTADHTPIPPSGPPGDCSS